MYITVLYGKLLENGHLEHRDRKVNPLKHSGYCEVPLAMTFKTVNIVHRMYACHLQNMPYNSTQN